MNNQQKSTPPVPPPDRPYLMFWFLLTWALMIIALVWGISQYKVETNEVNLNSTDYFLESHFQHYRNGMEKDLQITKREYLLAQAPPYLINGRVYSTLMDRIIECESGGDPTADNPYSTAYGLCQFIDGTWDYVQDKWDMKLDRKDEYDQRYACDRLLEEEDTGHWVSTQWCWDK